MDVGESPINESEEFCGALRFPGTMSLCEEPSIGSRLLEGGNRGTGFNVPLCEKHMKMWDKDPSSLDISIPPSPVKR